MYVAHMVCIFLPVRSLVLHSERGSVLYGTVWIWYETLSFSVKMGKEVYSMIYYFTLDVDVTFPVKYEEEVMLLALKQLAQKFPFFSQISFVSRMFV
jgi:hypothetical protein